MRSKDGWSDAIQTHKDNHITLSKENGDYCALDEEVNHAVEIYILYLSYQIWLLYEPIVWR